MKNTDNPSSENEATTRDGSGVGAHPLVQRLRAGRKVCRRAGIEYQVCRADVVDAVYLMEDAAKELECAGQIMASFLAGEGCMDSVFSWMARNTGAPSSSQNA